MSFCFQFFSLKGSFGFSAEGGNAGDFWKDVFECFGVSPVYVLREFQYNPLQQKSELMLNKVDKLVKKYGADFPELFRFRSFIRSLKEGENFYFYDRRIELSQKDELAMLAQLTACQAGTNPVEASGSMLDLFGNFLDTYEIDGASSDRKIYIGNRQKAKRQCRFCSNTRAELESITSNVKRTTTFIQEAHAISEALGNKTLILCDECDACNAHFAKNCETQILLYLKLFTAFFKIKNKENKISTIKGKNFILTYITPELRNKVRGGIKTTNSTSQTGINQSIEIPVDARADDSTHVMLDNLELSLAYWRLDDEDHPKSEGPPESVSLRHYDQLSMQEIYKALVKFALGVIKSENLSRFKSTVEWLSGDNYKATLPKIAILSSYKGFTKEPEMTVYLKKSGRPNNLPSAVGEFAFTYLRFFL